MKPCIVIWDRQFDVYEAYNEDVRLIVRRSDWQECVNEARFHYGYEVIPHNTRFAKTILDKLNQHHI